MKRVELLAPAGDLDKLKLALLYGADACYIGGKEFSLRSHASNFTLNDIKEACDFAHALHKKVHVTCNIVMHNDNTKHIKEYLLNLEKCGVDAIITSSIAMLEIANKYTNLEVHMSTQLSSLNDSAVDFFYKHHAKRVVLGRECSLEDIKNIKKVAKTEIEVFIHGGMCSSYSGKCMLSNVMTGRDANRGGCAHSCRWKYYLYNDNKKAYEDYFSMSSKDLCALKEIPALIDMGVDSLKIEGRMKSYNYLCAIISSYRQLIDDYYDHKPLDYAKYENMISQGENRITGHGFLLGNVTINEQLFTLNDKFEKAGDFIGIVREVNNDEIVLEVKNKIIKGEEYLCFSPNMEPRKIKIEEIRYNDIDYDVFTIAGLCINIKCNAILKPYDIIHVSR